jgi:MFS family permease
MAHGLVEGARRARAGTRFALYAGGFLGPLGGGVVTVLIPDLRHALHTTTAGAAATLTVYLVPFALLQLVSGTIGERIGLARAIRGAYVAYAAVSVGVALTSSLVPFLVLRGLQGSANAFTTPLLVAALADVTPRESLGRAMGTFASVQTAAVVMAPLVGGAAGAIDYRLAFLVPAGVALLLATTWLPSHDPGERTTPTLRSALTRRTAALSAFAFVGYLSTLGVAFLVALRAADRFGLSAGTRGLLLAGFGFVGVLAGRPIGGLIDRYGPLRLLALGAAGAALTIPLPGLAPTAGLLALTWAVAGLSSQVIWANVYTLAVDAAPGNRAGAVSIVGACRFAGNATAPLAWLPLYEAHAWLPFAAAGALLAALAGAVRRIP